VEKEFEFRTKVRFVTIDINRFGNGAHPSGVGCKISKITTNNLNAVVVHTYRYRIPCDDLRLHHTRDFLLGLRMTTIEEGRKYWDATIVHELDNSLVIRNPLTLAPQLRSTSYGHKQHVYH
jgi:hypothetical protein